MKAYKRAMGLPSRPGAPPKLKTPPHSSQYPHFWTVAYPLTFLLLLLPIHSYAHIHPTIPHTITTATMYRITTASATATRGLTTTRCITRQFLIRPSQHTRATQRRLLQTQIPQNAHGAGASHALAGVAGGVAVLAGGYAYYKFSGAADVVASAQKTVATVKQVTDAAPSPAQAGHAVVKAIRAVAPSFFKVVPGLDSVVDQGFEQLDELAETHGEEVEKLVKDTYAELAKLAKRGFNEDTLKEATVIVSAKLDEAQKLAIDIGSDATDKIFAKNPELKKTVQSSINELKEMVDVPEAQKILNETYAEIKKMADKGFSPEAVLAAGVFVKGQVSKAKNLASETGEAAWDKAADLAQPYLKKMPAVQKLLDGKIDDLKQLAKENGGPELEKIVTDLYTELKKIGDKGINKDSIAQATKLVESKLAEAAKLGAGAAGKAGDVAWDKASELAKPYLKKMPEVQKLLDEKMGDIKKIANENGGPELGKILTDMYTELSKLSEKGINKDTIAKATKIVEKKLAEAADVGSKAASKAGDAIWDTASEAAAPYLKKMPEVQSLIEDRAEEIKKIAKANGGPELEKIIKDMYADLKKVSDKGINKKSLEEAKKIVEDKLAAASKIGSDVASKAGDAVWDKATEAASPYLKKMPEIQSLIEDRADEIKKLAKSNGGPELEEVITVMYADLKKVADKGVNKKSLAEAKKIVEDSLSRATDIGSKAASDVSSKAWKQVEPLLTKHADLKSIVDDRLGDLKDVAAKHGPKGEKILEETYAKIAKIAEKGVSKDTVKELKSVLHQQYDKARALAEDVQDDL
ncbi:uncharacterized protein EV422DRAFT_523618 [Fimicolochytrium jonesii]|uniref:uncharacterized protein n=1 Tax=Fimicolochytrium jonesii TaxID=1396493 RepID=UPI0022FEBB0C|nr:uncharacterized protein EV422DRAFT_523618 [Fimicolochytrium jonesii]KAI8823172.1 hypothetical protein EV422DRAFT_523618 [Fimicolochytrium jonesii]